MSPRLAHTAFAHARAVPAGRRLVWAGVLLALLLTGCTASPQPVEVVDGVLDLRGTSFDGPITLHGTWLARAGVDSLAFLEYSYDAHPSDSGWQAVPITDNFQAQGFPDEGMVWYRARVMLPSDAPPLLGFVQHANNAHALYAARPGRPPQLLAASGWPALQAEAATMSRAPVLFRLPSGSSLVLTWKVANHGYLKGGAFHTIQLGPAPLMRKRVWQRSFLVAVQAGGLLTIAVLFLLTWLWYRPDVQSLVVALLSATTALRTVTVAGVWETAFPETMTFQVRILLEGLTFFGMVALFTLLIWSFLPRLFVPVRLGARRLHPPSDLVFRAASASPRAVPRSARRALTAAVLAVVGASLLGGLLTLLAQPAFTTYLLAAGRWLTLLVLPLALVATALGVVTRQPLGPLLAVGIVPVLLAGLHDVLFAAGWIRGLETYISGPVYLVFIAVQSYAVARRNARNEALARYNADTLRAEVARQTRELQVAAQAARSANEAKSRFLSAVSHELRSPLASIAGYTRLLREEAPGTPPPPEFLEAIADNASRLMRLVSDLLEAARAETGGFTLALTDVAVQPLVEELIAEMTPLVEPKGVTLDLDVRMHHAFVHADGDRLRQVLINLLSNAIKFTEAGTVTVTIDEATLGARPACAIAVRDTGPGIGADFLPHLFQPFRQEARTYSHTLSGAGLGLAISRQLVQRMQGDITVATEVGTGSVFTVVLPLALTAHAPAPLSSRPASLL